MDLKTKAAIALLAGLVTGGLLVAVGPGRDCQLNRIGDICDPPADYVSLFTEWAYLSVPGAVMTLLVLLVAGATRRQQHGQPR